MLKRVAILTGIQKPLTLYFLRRAHMIYSVHPENGLSPLFADAEMRLADHEGHFDSIVPNIEHSIGASTQCASEPTTYGGEGRLMYKTGETEQAVRLFLGLLKESLPISVSSDLNFGAVAPGSTEADTDKTFLEDFRLAFEVRSPLVSPLECKLNGFAALHSDAWTTCDTH